MHRFEVVHASFWVANYATLACS